MSMTVDDFAVQSVQIAIQNGDGSLVEQGQAQHQADPRYGDYRTTTTNASLDGNKIPVTANDSSGHSDVEERVL